MLKKYTKADKRKLGLHDQNPKIWKEPLSFLHNKENNFFSLAQQSNLLTTVGLRWDLNSRPLRQPGNTSALSRLLSSIHTLCYRLSPFYFSSF